MGYSFEEIERIVDDLTFEYKHLRHNPSSLLSLLLENNNIVVDEIEICENKISGNLKCDSELKLITLNKQHFKKRKLFTTGHEFGHYVLHKQIKQNFTCVDLFEKTPLEMEANFFSATLLMPTEIVVAYLSIGLTPKEIARQLGVSISAINWRIFNLLNKSNQIIKILSERNIALDQIAASQN